MKVEVVGSTKPDYLIQHDEALRFSGIAAGVCYMPHTMQLLSDEPVERTIKRIRGCIRNGHHSVLEHIVFNLYLENIPKILAMILNNEKVYATSEKSSRYTEIHLDTADGRLYQKWVPIFEEQISKKYPEIPSAQVKRLAFENARYLISIFSPTSSMVYTVSMRQLSYIIDWMKKYIASPSKDMFSVRVKDVLKHFLSTNILDTDMCFENLAITGVTQQNKSLSLFAPFQRHDEIGENYCLTYSATFACLAQVQRHRTLKYEFAWWKKTPRYYTPQIIVRNEDLKNEWQNDIKSLKNLYPQGMLVDINERGTLDDFILKCHERLCGQAQLETARTTKFILDYLSRFFENNKLDLYKRLSPYVVGPRCTFPDFECKNPCIWGWKKALKRTV